MNFFKNNTIIAITSGIVGILVGLGWFYFINTPQSTVENEEKEDLIVSERELTEGTENWLTYTSPTSEYYSFSFAIRYPKDWVVDNSDDNDVTFTLANLKDDNDGQGSIHFSKLKASVDKDECDGGYGNYIQYSWYCPLSRLWYAEGFVIPLVVEKFTTESGSTGYKTVWLTDIVATPEGFLQEHNVSNPLVYLEINSSLMVELGTLLDNDNIEYVVGRSDLEHIEIFEKMIRTFEPIS
ncbi:MAG: hypothetical protein Q8P37_00400 [Candidatus Spechtbacteria bacterium]|nr:hypothetical protein [Candidatus Spechtbacteria bacterium]